MHKCRELRIPKGVWRGGFLKHYLQVRGNFGNVAQMDRVIHDGSICKLQDLQPFIHNILLNRGDGQILYRSAVVLGKVKVDGYQLQVRMAGRQYVVGSSRHPIKNMPGAYSYFLVVDMNDCGSADYVEESVVIGVDHWQPAAIRQSDIVDIADKGGYGGK